MSAETRKWVDDKDLFNIDVVTTQFMHIFNLYAIFGDKGLKELENQLVEAGWNDSQLQTVQRAAMAKSNWNKNSYVRDRLESDGKQNINITY